MTTPGTGRRAALDAEMASAGARGDGAPGGAGGAGGVSRYADLVNAARRQILTDALTAVAGNRTQAARALGITPRYLRRLNLQLGIDVPPPPRAKLTPAQRVAVVQRFLAGESCNRLAVEHDVSLETVYALVRAARRRTARGHERRKARKEAVSP